MEKLIESHLLLAQKNAGLVNEITFLKQELSQLVSVL
jgi:hypothetical protein